MTTILQFALYAAIGLAALLLAMFAFLVVARYRRRPKFRSGPLRPFEQAVLTALLERSEAPIRERLGKQIPLLSTHHRSDFAKQVTLELYPGRANYAQIDAADVAFANRAEFRLATMSFTAGDTKFTAQFGAVNGHLFDVVVRPNPRRFKRVSDITVTRFKTLTNPLTAPATATFDEQLAAIDATLPEDYVEALRAANGFERGRWRVLPLSEVRSVALGGRNYYCLADDGDFAVCVREGSRDRRLYTCAIEDDSVLPEEGSFLEILDRPDE